MAYRQPWQTLDALWSSLTLTRADLPEPARRRARILAALTLLVILSIALFAILIYVVTPSELHLYYTILLIGAEALLISAFRLNRNGHYRVAADLVVTCTVLTTWAAILLNLRTLAADSTPILYLFPPVLLASFLLHARETLILAGVQISGLLLLNAAGYIVTTTPFLGIVGFLLFVMALCIVSAFVTRQDLVQIDRQTRQLQENQARLHELSIRDALTGAFNRRYLEETLDRELHRAQQQQAPLGVIMLDVDYFKHYNDTHGHAAGDQLLTKLSAFLQTHIRDADVVCRYGGDELTIVLPNASRQVTLQRAQEIRQHLKTLTSEQNWQILTPITLSLGVAAYPEDGSTRDQVLKSADDALYTAKRLGRDRVIAAD